MEKHLETVGHRKKKWTEQLLYSGREKQGHVSVNFIMVVYAKCMNPPWACSIKLTFDRHPDQCQCENKSLQFYSHLVQI